MDQLSEKDRLELKRLITTEPEVLTDTEIKDVHARRDYLSSKIISLFVPRFQELGLYGYEVEIEEGEIIEKPKKVAKK